MLADTSVIHEHGAFAVIAECQPVLFKDWTMVALHRVHHHGSDSMFLRAFLLGDKQWLIIDLRTVARTLATEIPELPARDTDGLVLYTLRRDFQSVDDFHARALKHVADLSAATLDYLRDQVEGHKQLRAA
jgi:hypothetical protein